jgi:hypothetical protein
VDECITMWRRPKDHYWNDAQWDVNGIRYEVSGFSPMSLGQLTLELLQRRYPGITGCRSYYAM